MRWLSLTRATLAAAIDDDLLNWAAVVAFYFLFALFPAVLFVASLMGTLHLHALIQQLVADLGRHLPPSARDMVSKALLNRLSGHVPALISIGLALLLYSASQGFTGLMAGLNAAYEVPETRSYLHRVLLGVGLTFSAGLLMTLALALLLGGQHVVDLISARWLAPLLGTALGFLIRWAITIGFLVLSVRLLYRFAPNVRRQSSGAYLSVAVALVVWFIASAGLAYYGAHFSNFSVVYGSLGAVIMLMMWFYVLAISLLLGAETHNEWLKMHGIRSVPPVRAHHLPPKAA